VIPPVPTAWWLRPESIAARVDEQSAVVWCSDPWRRRSSGRPAAGPESARPDGGIAAVVHRSLRVLLRSRVCSRHHTSFVGRHSLPSHDRQHRSGSGTYRRRPSLSRARQKPSTRHSTPSTKDTASRRQSPITSTRRRPRRCSRRRPRAAGSDAKRSVRSSSIIWRSRIRASTGRSGFRRLEILCLRKR